LHVRAIQRGDQQNQQGTFHRTPPFIDQHKGYASRIVTRQSAVSGDSDSTPDGVVYVALTNEVWVTAPRDNSVRILDTATLTQKEKLTFEGRPEGYAVDAKRGRLGYEGRHGLSCALTARSIGRVDCGIARQQVKARSRSNITPV
jgi:hypothetical protein